MNGAQTAPPAVNARGSGRPGASPAWRRAIALAVILLAVGTAWWRFQPTSGDGLAAIVGVLPFQAPQGDHELDAFGAAFADMIANGLAASDGVTAVPRSAAMPYRHRAGAGADLQQIARELGATHLVDGTLRRTAAGAELKVWIVRVQRDAGWQQWYPFTRDEVLGLSRRIAGDVVAQLGAVPLTPNGTATSIEAFQQYAQGRALLDSRDIPGNVDRAIELLMAAVGRQDDFTLARAALGEAYWEKYGETGERSWADRAEQQIRIALAAGANQPLVRYSLATIFHGTGQSLLAEQELRTIVRTSPLDSAHRLLGIILVERGEIDEATQEFRRAIDLRPGYWGNHAARGAAALNAGRYSEAEASFRRAIELQPENAESHINLGTVCLLTGRHEEATAWFERSIRLAPSAAAWANLGTALAEAGRHDEALHAFRQAAAMQPRDALLRGEIGDSLLRLGRTPEARDAYRDAVRVAREAIDVSPASAEAHGALAVCLAKAGQFTEAMQHVDRATSLAPESHEPYRRRAAVLALAGRNADAITALREAIKRGLSPAAAARDDDFEPLRRSPEFQRLIRPRV